ncbi:hypothetical protein BD770DRAFT_448795 [Pilaira anomala]|nr:hypothetical protein BD770DRAFT_448795 [Pilaira anomala]
MTDKFNPINVWNKHRYEDRIETVDIEHDDDNNASKLSGTTVTHHYEREQRSSSIDEVTNAEAQREPVQIHPSDFGDYPLHSDHISVQDSGVKNCTEDMVPRIPPTLQDLNKSSKGEPPEYQAKSPLTHDEDISFFGDSKVANDKSRTTLDQEGLHSGSITTLPAAGQRRKSLQKSSDQISRNDNRSSQKTETESPESHQNYSNKGSNLIDMAVATVATVGAVGASLATGVTNAFTGSPTKENNHEMPSSWPSSEESVNTDDGNTKDTQPKTSTYRSKNQTKEAKSSDDQVTKDDKHGFCDRIEEPEIQGQNPSFYDNNSKGRRWSEGWQRSNSATPPENRTFSKGLLATGASATGAAGAATVLGKQSSVKTGETTTKGSKQDTSRNSLNDDFIENELSEEVMVDSDDDYTDSGIPTTWGDQITPVSEFPNSRKTYETQSSQGYRGDEGITSLPRNVNLMNSQHGHSSQGLNYSNSQDQNLVDKFSSGDRTNKLASAVAAGSLTGAGATAAYINRKNGNRSREEGSSQRWLSNRDNISSNDTSPQGSRPTEWTEVDQDINLKTWTKKDQSLPIGTGQDEKHEAFVDQNLNRPSTQQTKDIVQGQKAFGGNSAFGDTGTTAVPDSQHAQRDGQDHNSSGKGIVGAAAAAVGGLFGIASKEKHNPQDPKDVESTAHSHRDEAIVQDEGINSTDEGRYNSRPSSDDHIHEYSYEQSNKDTISPIGGDRYEVDQNDIELGSNGRYESAHDTSLESIGGGRFETDSSPIDHSSEIRHVKGTNSRYNNKVPSRNEDYEQSNDDTITSIGGGRYEVDQNDVKLNRDGRYQSTHATNLEPLGGGLYEVDSSPVAPNDRSRYESIQDESVQPADNSREKSRQSGNVPTSQGQYERLQENTITPIGGNRYEVDQNDVAINRDGRYESIHTTNVAPIGDGRYDIDASDAVRNNESNYKSVQENTVDPIRGTKHDSSSAQRNNDTDKGAVAGAAGAAAAVGGMFGLNQKNKHDTSTRSTLPVSNIDQDNNNSSALDYSHSKPDTISNNQTDLSSSQRGINTAHHTSNVETRSNNVNSYPERSSNNKPASHNSGKGGIKAAAAGAAATVGGILGLNHENKRSSTNNAVNSNNVPTEDAVFGENDNHVYGETTDNNTYGDTKGNAFYGANVKNNTSYGQNEIFEGTAANKSHDKKVIYQDEPISTYNDDELTNTATVVDHDDPKRRNPFAPTDFSGNEPNEADFQNVSTETRNVQRDDHHPIQQTIERVDRHPLEQASERPKVNNPGQQNAQADYDIENQNTEHKSAKTAIVSALGLDHHNKHSNDISSHKTELTSTTNRSKDAPSVPQKSNTSTVQPDYNVENQNTKHRSAKTATADTLGLDHHNKHSDDATTLQNKPITTAHRSKEVPSASRETKDRTINPPYGYDIYHEQDARNHNNSDKGVVSSTAAALGLNHDHKSQDRVNHSNPYHSVQGQGHHGEGIHDKNVIGGTSVGSNDDIGISHTATHEPITTTAALGSTLGGEPDTNATTRNKNSDKKRQLNTSRRDSIVPGLPSEIAEEDHSGNFSTSQPIPYEPSSHNREPPSNYDRRGSKGSITRRRSSIISAMMGGDNKNKKYSDKDTGYERSSKYQDTTLYSGRTKSLPSVKQHDADVRGSLFNRRHAEDEPEVAGYNSGQYARGSIGDNNTTKSNNLRRLPTHTEHDPNHTDSEINQSQVPLVDEPVHPMDTTRHGNNYESYEIENLKHDPVRKNSKSGNGIISSAGGILGLNHNDNNERDATANEHHSSMVASTVGVAGASVAPLGGVPVLREGKLGEKENTNDQPKYHSSMVASTVGVAGASVAPVGGILSLSGEAENEGQGANTGRNHFDNQRSTHDLPVSNRSYPSGRNNRNSLNGREAGGKTNNDATTYTTTSGQHVTATEAAVAAAPRGNTNVSDEQYKNAYSNAKNVNNKSSKGPMAAVSDKLGLTHHNVTGQNQSVNYQDHTRFAPRQNVNYQGANNHQDFNRSNHLSENNNDTIHRGQQNPMINENTHPSHENYNHGRPAHARDVESVSSTRATTGKIVPDICNDEVARRRSLVHQPGGYNTVDQLNNPSHRKNSLTQDIKEKFSNAVRRLSLQGSDAPHNEHRLSAAEVYKNEQQSTNHHPNNLGNNTTHGSVSSYQEQNATRGTNVVPRNESITGTTRNVSTAPQNEPITGTTSDNLNIAPRNVPINRNINAAPLNSNVLSRNEPITSTRPAQQSNVLPQNNAHPIILSHDNALNSTTGSNINVNTGDVGQTTAGTRQGNSHVPGVYTLRPAGEISIINNEGNPNGGPVKAIIIPAKEGA